MPRKRTLALAVLALGLSAPLAWQLKTPAQTPAAEPRRFEFQIVESVDAEYLGDTPAHKGRGGSLGKAIPRVALEDPVYRGQERIGSVTRVAWDRTKESLEIEFDPEPKVRISVGETAWISLNGPAQPEKKP